MENRHESNVAWNGMALPLRWWYFHGWGWTFILALATYVASMAAPVSSRDGKYPPNSTGLAVFLSCFKRAECPEINLLVSSPNFSFAGGVLALLVRRGLIAAIMAGLGAVFGILLPIIGYWLMITDDPQAVSDDRLAAGYYLWISSLILLMIAGVQRWLARSHDDDHPESQWIAMMLVGIQRRLRSPDSRG